MVARISSCLRGRARGVAVAAIAVATLAVTLPVLAAPPTITTIALPAGSTPIGIANGPGGVWFAEPTNAVVGVIDDAGTVTTWPVTEADASPTSIAAGPDGAVWFTEPGINSIGRMTTAGDTQDFAMSVTGSNPSSVAAGPDGNIWYTLRSANRIGWGTTAGFQEITLAGTPGPSWITAGPDGGMWFAGPRGNVVGRVDVATKQVTTYQFPTGSEPNSIVAGADGAMWFTLRGSNQLGRMTVGGAVSLVSLPATAPANAGGIAAGADGSIWLAMTALDRVARYAEGSFEVFAVGTSPRTIAVDATGDAWVTISPAGDVTRIHIDTTPPDVTPPTITIDAPATGDWVVAGSSGLAADYACADETALASCVGDVADGSPVADTALGARTFDVHAEDAAGNIADATASYLVFRSADGTLLGAGDVRPGAWLTLSLGMDLPHRAADPLAGASTQVVNCGTGEALGAHEPATVRTRVGPRGTLELRWDTDRSWSGCRTLWLSFSATGWAGPEAMFGPVRFAGAAAAKRAR